MSLKDAIAEDIHNVFLNLEEYAERRCIRYDDRLYENIPVVMSGLKEQERHQLMSDHVQGLYLVTNIMHCALSDFGGHQPEKGQKICINEPDVPSFYREYYIASSQNTAGMLRMELEAIDE